MKVWTAQIWCQAPVSTLLFSLFLGMLLWPQLDHNCTDSLPLAAGVWAVLGLVSGCPGCGVLLEALISAWAALVCL